MDNTQFAKIIAKVWADPTFAAALVQNPSQALAKEGIEAPNNLRAEILLSTSTRLYMTIPARPVGVGGPVTRRQLASVMDGCHVAEETEVEVDV
ncbi:MAG TPA: hypothetical protein VF584_26755 [Longimicrobium sp.]|jgi:hypothetical protein